MQCEGNGGGGGMEAETDRGEKPGTCASTLTTPTPEEQDQLCNVGNESVPHQEIGTDSSEPLCLTGQ